MSGRASAAKATRWGASVRRISPIRRRMPDDLAEDRRIAPTPERAFVEAVDLALDVLDQLEVVGQHLVGDRGDEARRVERTQPRLTLGRGVEPGERRQRLVVDGHDPVPAGHDVDRAADQMRSVLMTIVPGRLGDLEDQVDVLGIERQVGALGRVGQPLERPGLEADRVADGVEVGALRGPARRSTAAACRRPATPSPVRA